MDDRAEPIRQLAKDEANRRIGRLPVLSRTRWLGRRAGTLALAFMLGACSSTSSPTPAAPSVTSPQSSAASSAPAPSPSSPSGSLPTLSTDFFDSFDSFYPWSQNGTAGDSLAMILQWDFLAFWDNLANQPQMRLADSITSSPDGKTWTVKLKQGIKWSDGTPFTAKDVLFSWQENANPTHSYNSGLWTNVVGVTDWQKGPDFSKPISGITAPDDGTVVFQLIEPDAGFIITMVNIRNFILPSAALLAASPDIHNLAQKDIWSLPYWQAPAVGIGPYLWDQTQTGQFVQFKPNPQWRGGALSFGHVILKVVASTAIAGAQLQSGDLDIANVNLDDLDGLVKAGFQIPSNPALFVYGSVFNISPSSRFKDAKIRQAFMYGCDRQGFVDGFLGGHGKKADTIFTPDWVPKDGITVYNFDLPKAKSLLDAVNFDYSKPVVWLIYDKNDKPNEAAAEDCQSKMATIGVKVSILNGIDVITRATVAGDWDLSTYGSYDVYDPNAIRHWTACENIGSTVSPSGYKSGGSNVTNYCNPKFDDLMKKADQITDQAQRAALYKQAQDIWLNDVPIMLQFSIDWPYAWTPKLHGVVPYGPFNLLLSIDQWSKTP